MTVFHVSVNVLLSPYCQEHPRTAPKLERLPASCTECYHGAPSLACHTDHKRHRMNNERHVTNSQFRRTERNCAEAAREKKRGGGCGLHQRRASQRPKQWSAGIGLQPDAVWQSRHRCGLAGNSEKRNRNYAGGTVLGDGAMRSAPHLPSRATWRFRF